MGKIPMGNVPSIPPKTLEVAKKFGKPVETSAYFNPSAEIFFDAKDAPRRLVWIQDNKVTGYTSRIKKIHVVFETSDFLVETANTIYLVAGTAGLTTKPKRAVDECDAILATAEENEQIQSKTK